MSESTDNSLGMTEGTATEDEICGIVAGAVLEVEGVFTLGANMSASAITKNLLNRENKVRGVHLISDEEGWIIDIYAIVDYGTKIPETAWNVQKRVSDRLGEALHIKPKAINIHIQGVHVSK